MKVTTIAWGLGLVVAGAAILAGWLPGPATGPRIGVGAFLLMLGILMLSIPLSVWGVARSRPEEGRCPVGEPCGACGAFNLKPRQACRMCDAPVNRDPAR